MTSLPVGLEFTEGPLLEAWGRIRNLSVGGLEIETHFPIKRAQKVYLSFYIEDHYHFEHSPARIIWIKIQEHQYSAGISFEENVDRAHLRDAMVFLVNRI